VRVPDAGAVNEALALIAVLTATGACGAFTALTVGGRLRTVTVRVAEPLSPWPSETSATSSALVRGRERPGGVGHSFCGNSGTKNSAA
jgi:hypothetical protein